MPRKSVWERVSEYHDEILKLKPTPEEIQAYADMLEREDRTYGTVTYSNYKKGNCYFIRFHDTCQKKGKRGGRTHIDVGYVDEKYIDKWNVPDTTHLMLDKDTAPKFIKFVKDMRKGEKIEKR